MSPAEAAKLVSVLLAAFPSSRATEATSQVYEKMLADLEYSAANAAIEALLATARFMPSISEIRAAALELARGPVRAGGEAWGSVTRAIREQGFYRTPGVDFTFNDPITARCVAALGWQTICSSELIAAERARLIELYDRLAAQNQREQQSPVLAAAAERRTGVIGAGGAISNVLRLVPPRPDDE